MTREHQALVQRLEGASALGKKEHKQLFGDLEKRISQFNESAAPIQKLSYPEKDFSFQTVVKVVYQARGQPETMKSVMIKSTTPVKELVLSLIDKFGLEGTNSKVFSLYEVLGEAQNATKLRDNDCPLKFVLAGWDSPSSGYFRLEIDGEKVQIHGLREVKTEAEENLNDSFMEMLEVEDLLAEKFAMEERGMLAERDIYLRTLCMVEKKYTQSGEIDQRTAINSIKQLVATIQGYIDDTEKRSALWNHAELLETTKVVSDALRETIEEMVKDTKTMLTSPTETVPEVAKRLKVKAERLSCLIKAMVSVTKGLRKVKLALEEGRVKAAPGTREADQVARDLVLHISLTVVEGCKAVSQKSKENYAHAITAVVRILKSLGENVKGSAKFQFSPQEVQTEIGDLGAELTNGNEKLLRSAKLACGLWPTPTAHIEMLDDMLGLAGFAFVFVVKARRAQVLLASTFSGQEFRRLGFVMETNNAESANKDLDAEQNGAALNGNDDKGSDVVISPKEMEHADINTAVMLNLQKDITGLCTAVTKQELAISEGQKDIYHTNTDQLLQYAEQLKDEIDAFETNFWYAPWRQLVLNSRTEMASHIRQVESRTKIATGVWPPADAAQKLLDECKALEEKAMTCVMHAKRTVERQKERVTTCKVQGLSLEEKRRNTQDAQKALALSQGKSTAARRSSGFYKDAPPLKDYNEFKQKCLTPKTPDGLLIAEELDGTKEVRGGLLDALAEQLMSPWSLDPVFKDTFMLTFHSFTTPMKLMDLLVKSYNVDPGWRLDPLMTQEFNQVVVIPVRLRIVDALKTWLNKNFEDFDGDPNLVDLLNEFCERLTKDLPSAAKVLKELYNRNKIYGPSVSRNQRIRAQSEAPKPIQPKRGDNMTLLDIDPLEAARQLCLIDFAIYKRIQPKECMDLAWSKKTLNHRAVNILSMINRFNDFTLWVAQKAIFPETAEERVANIRHLIKIATYCRQLNNYSAVMAIQGGMISAAVSRMKKTWALLTPKEKEAWDALCHIASNQDNFGLYRQELSRKDAPCIPFLGIYLTDLTFIEDGNPDMINGWPDYINFKKRRLYAEVINKMRQYQDTPYNFQAVRSISSYLTMNEQQSDEKELYDTSLKREPRGQ
eukprot:Clim_evm12s109 gene=Clim_evmTU12s109